jgi:hypothetical protein
MDGIQNVSANGPSRYCLARRFHVMFQQDAVQP